MQTYRPRRIEFVRVIEHDGFMIKLYTIDHENADVALNQFDGAMRLAFEALPIPARTHERPGVAFLIAHRGNGVDYAVLAWWDRGNEMPLRVFVREPRREWRPARGSESVCVWDLQVIAHERDAYVKHMMNGAASSAEAYLADGLGQRVA